LVRRGCLGIHWHFIGHLQTNKINSIIPYVSLIHTIDSEKLALKLAQKWLQAKRSEKCGIFIEVNLDEEKTKSGIPPQEVETLCKKISQIPELRILGLMGIPKPGSDSRLKFKKLSALEHLCRSYTEGMLSMGMSDDFETAIEEGATHIRVGTALFGPRHEN